MQPIHRLFTADVLDSLARIRRPAPSPWDSDGIPVRERHLVVTCSGPEPSRARWARRSAWAAYLRAAERCGLLESPDVVARLVGTDDDGFRSALAECLATWFFAVRRRVSVRPNPAPKTKKNFDLLLEGAGAMSLNAEVKAPYVPLSNRSWAGDDAAVLRESIEKAGTQLNKDSPNVVVLVPLLRTSVTSHRSQLLKATIGEHALSVPIVRDRRPPPKPKPTFLQEGKLAKLWPERNGAFRTDLTRISAVMTIEEHLVERGAELRVAQSVVVIHNPFATHRIPRSFFGSAPQWLTTSSGKMGWSDRYRGP